MRRSLTYFWRMNLAVVAGVAVTTAVLTGALLVGDSLRGSLEGLTLDRLGSIEVALLNQRFFPADLADRFAARPQLRDSAAQVAPAILLRGSVTHGETDLRASGVQVIGVDSRFGALYPETGSTSELTFERLPTQVFPSAVVNQALARELSLAVGDDLLLSLGRASDIPTASLMGRRDEASLLTTVRVTVTEILPVNGPGRFGLEARQNQPLNLFLELSTLARRLDRRGQANTLLIGGFATDSSARLGPEALDLELQEALGIADLGLKIEPREGSLAIESQELVLRPALVESLESLAEESKISTWRYLTYLANAIETGERSLPYSTVAAIEMPIPEAVGALTDLSGRPVHELGEDQILLTEWAFEDLDAGPGDRLDLTYFLVGSNDELITSTTRFEVSAIALQRSLGADPTLTPAVPGVTDADNMAGWDPPFPVDLARVRPRDEAYWDEFRGAPKAFVALETGQRLWRSRYGALTAIRWIPAETDDLPALEALLEDRLPRSLAPDVVGYEWLPVLEQGLRGASGTTDFAGLFIGFSLFLIVSASLLVGLLFALLVEQRAREAGLLLATGHPLRSVRRRFLVEGGWLALLGALLGTGLSLLYTRLVLAALADWWAPILDQPILTLHIEALTLLIGGGSAVLLTLLVVSLSVRRLSRISSRQLLAGSVSTPATPRSRRLSLWVSGTFLALATLLVILALRLGMESAPALFFGVGASLVIAGIAAFASWCRAERGRTSLSPRRSIVWMSARNSARNVGRSLLSVTLVAAASFVLVSVSASRKTHRDTTFDRGSGTGGFSLVAEADTPLPAPLTELESLPADSGSVFSLRLLPGDDASCLNLYQPEKPRLLGVPRELIERGGFSFQDTLEERQNPWELLDLELPDGAIPALGDYNSVRWILHSGLGQELLMENEDGEPLRLRIVGLLRTSIFQSELLISEKAFLENFPDRSGFGFFLGEVPAASFETTRALLESDLARFGLDVESAGDRLEEFQAIENMYLATFEVLGGLGLLLGTLGLGIVLLRNTIERRGELAALRAFGYRRATLAWMVVGENAFLLALGLAIGGGAGLIAVGPYLLSGGIDVPWASLLAILSAVFAVGLLASLAAVGTSLKVPLLPALKSD